MTTIRPFDVVICVGVKDVLIVKKTVRYVNKYICPMHIFLLTHKKFFGFYSQRFLQDEHVCLINESTLVPGMDITSIRTLVDSHFTHKMRAGWYFQQFLKMGFALSPYASDYYLIWDADTLPTSPLTFFDEEGRMLLARKTEYHTPYFDTMQRLIGMGKSVDFSFIAEHMIIKTEYMKLLINNILQSGWGGVNPGMKPLSMPFPPNKVLASLNLKPMALMCITHIPKRLPIALSIPSAEQVSCSAVA